MLSFLMVMKILILCLLLMFASPTLAQEVDCSLHKLYCTMLELRPTIDKTWAMRLSDALFRLSKKHETDPWRSLAIAMQESSLREVNKKHKVMVFKETCHQGICIEDYEIINGISDLGLFQFNVSTVINNDIDPMRLRNDITYAVDWHLKILKKKMVECAWLLEEAWSCYHSKTPKFRKRYVQMVEQYYFGEKPSDQSHIKTALDEH